MSELEPVMLDIPYSELLVLSERGSDLPVLSHSEQPNQPRLAINRGRREGGGGGVEHVERGACGNEERC